MIRIKKVLLWGQEIECAFAWLKAYLRSEEAGTRKELIAAIARAGRLIGEVLASAWFVGCGYLV